MIEKPYSDWIRFLAEHPETVEVVASDDAAEQADVMICRLATNPLGLPDNLLGHCSKCFRMVQFRPHSPKTPKRICDECAGPMLQEEMKDKGFQTFITPETAADVAAFMSRKGRH